MKKKSPTQVILTQFVSKLGDVGEQVKVSSGYARNYLLAKEKAVPANDYWTNHFKHRRKEFVKNESVRLELATELKEQLAEFTLEMTASASRSGSLYGSIGAKEILAALKEQNVEIDQSEISIPQRNIREIGLSYIKLNPHPTISIDIGVNITPL